MAKNDSKKISKKSQRPLTGRVLVYVLLFIAALAIVAARYKIAYFGDAKVDEVLFYFTNGLEGMNTGSFWEIAQKNFVSLLLFFGLLCLPVIDFYRDRVTFNFTLRRKGKERVIKFNPSRIRFRYKIAYAATASILAVGFFVQSFGVIQYIRAQFESGTLFEDEYVDPRDVKLTFPEKKRNLVYIYLESFENTIASRSNGGMSDISYMPELEKIALDSNNITFSNTNALGGALSMNGATWTVGSLTAQSAGIPLKSSFEHDRNSMGQFKEFLPGAYTLGQILEKEGYNQLFIIGSDIAFGGRDKLFGQHGNYDIFDFNTAKERGKIDPSYKVWWGYEDKKLFEYAKEELTALSQKPDPFNFQLLTVDTHFANGYLDETCPTPYSEQYFNVYACSSRQVSDFVHWVQAQPFAEDTTIIITGDHLGMQTELYERMIGGNAYQRTIYNAFINSVAEPTGSKTNRVFTVMDMYPTTLAALGVKVEGERLGLGVNLFSTEATLAERYGIDNLNNELAKRSRFYNTNILVN